MMGKVFLLVDAEARANLPGELKLSDLGQRPWEICIYVTATNYKENASSPVVRTEAVWFWGSRGSIAFTGARGFRAPDLGFTQNAPTADGDKEGNGPYLKEH